MTLNLWSSHRYLLTLGLQRWVTTPVTTQCLGENLELHICYLSTLPIEHLHFEMTEEYYDAMWFHATQMSVSDRVYLEHSRAHYFIVSIVLLILQGKVWIVATEYIYLLSDSLLKSVRWPLISVVRTRVSQLSGLESRETVAMVYRWRERKAFGLHTNKL